MTEQPTDLTTPAPGALPKSDPSGATPTEAPIDVRAVVSWSLYDFANSAFATIVVTFVYATFFTKAMAGPGHTAKEAEIIGTKYWGIGVAITAAFVALLSPYLGAIADRAGLRKVLLGVTTLICILATLGLCIPVPGQMVLALTLFIIANVAFELSSTFYNAFLPDIAPASKIGTISGIGWGVGYIGGLLAMAICLFVFIQPEWTPPGFDPATSGYVRATNLVVALWFAIFALPIFLWVKEDKSKASPSTANILRETTMQLVETWRELRRYKEILKFLGARVFFNDALVTIFNFGAIYAATVYGFDGTEVLYFGILLNVTAAIGAVGLGFLDDRIGGKNTILVTIIAISICTLIAMLASDKLVFWIVGAVLGIFVGPNQSSSRSLMSRFVPDEKENEFFGFFAFSGKATAFMGPLLLGLLTEAFQTQRAGFGVVLLFMLIGGVILSFVDEKAGIAAAARGGVSHSQTGPSVVTEADHESS